MYALKSSATSLLLLYASFKIYQTFIRRQKIKTNERVVIIGASSGIVCFIHILSKGKELAIIYAKRGASLLLVARRKLLLEQIVNECKEYSLNVQYFVADVTLEDQVDDCAKYSNEYLGGVDTLIVSCGILSVSSFEQICAQEQSLNSILSSIFQTNVFGPMYCAKYFRKMLKDSRGKFSVISSVAGSIGAPTRSLYSSTKFAINGFLESLRIEWANSGISIIIICPSTVNTDLRKSALDSSKAVKSSSGLSPTDVALRIQRANDARERIVYIPSYYEFVLMIKYFWPRIIEYFAAKKYGYSSS